MRITRDAPQPLPPYREWQARELEERREVARWAIFAAPRTGKTRVAGQGAAEQFRDRKNRPKIVVVAPIKVCVAWAEMLRDCGVAPIMHGYEGTVASLAAEIPKFAGGAIILNQDRIGRRISQSKYAKKLWEVLAAWKPHCYIRDESHRDKDPQSEMGKASRKIASAAKWVRILTGTPSPNHYGDLWGQMVSINSGEFFSRYGDFRQRYLVCDSMFPSKVLAHINTGELQDKLLRNASFYTRETVFGPDQWVTDYRYVTLAPKARKLYDDLATQWILDMEGGEVRADHILKRITRLQQATSGFLPDELGIVHELHTEKIDAVVSDLSEVFAQNEKAVVFHRFRWEGRRLADRIRSEYPKVKVYEINGDTSPEHTRMIEGLFTIDEPAVVIGQTQAAGLGISLAPAAYVKFISQTFSFTDEEQARDRVFAPGKTRIATYYRVANSIDEFIAEIIENKENIHQSVTRADREVMAYGRIARRRRKIA